MKPYYQRENYRIYHGDCSLILPELGEQYDLLLTDPPYGINYQSGRRQKKFDVLENDNSKAKVKDLLDVVAKYLKEYRHAYIFGPEDIFPDSLTAKVPLIWDKQNLGMGDLTLPWGLSHEIITFAVKCNSVKNRNKGYGKLAAKLRRGSVLREQRKNNKKSPHHPTEKPVGILRQMIESSTMLGEVVLDPFLGSGSTMIAAILESRSCVGIEIDERYAEIAAKRVDRALDIFSQIDPNML